MEYLLSTLGSPRLDGEALIVAMVVSATNKTEGPSGVLSSQVTLGASLTEALEGFNSYSKDSF